MHHREPEDFRYGTPEDAQDDLGLELVDDVAQHTSTRRSAPVKKWMLVAGAALVVVIGIVALVLALMPRDVAGEVKSAPDVTEKTIAVDGGGDAVLRLSQSLDAGSLTLTNLSGAPQGQTYQVWVEATGGGSASSLEVLDPSDTQATVGFKGLKDSGCGQVTTEPEGGSTEPG
ncbi:anti-sigma factor domain-containing protein, partial [Arthrobacter sp.]|uniref:anti-sigma factor domain-containing protein n=1 Tax=Arthrobacter sp. TaxID=1667 RepID=UPI003A8E7AD6